MARYAIIIGGISIPFGKGIAMQWQGLKVPVIIFSLLLGLVVIFGIQWVYQKYSFQNPINTVLASNEAVDSFQVKTEGGIIKVTLAIKSDAELMKSYQTVQKDLAQKMGRRQYYLELTDSRDDQLQQLWYKCQFPVYQAIAQGSYQNMADELNREAGLAGSEAKIYIDQQNLYIRLKKDGRTLDQVIARDPGQLNNNYQKSLAGGGAASVQGN
ncbi:MAG: hypothetical protein A4E53_02730 [Pelotomaculum sp. PtaB.Bin104]|nr:MAG: hypothetical protein A4E53_02730 [Pelotomaculum sp. PtaB.Bin104]